MLPRLAFLLFSLPLLLLASCGSGDGALRVDAAWTRPSPQGAQNGAFYMTISNETDEDVRLREVRSDLCRATELHQTVITEEGVMQMSPVEQEGLPIPAGETVALAPGGLHAMCVGVSEPLQVGDQVPLTVVFAEAGEVEVNADVLEQAP